MTDSPNYQYVIRFLCSVMDIYQISAINQALNSKQKKNSFNRFLKKLIMIGIMFQQPNHLRYSASVDDKKVRGVVETVFTGQA